MLTVQDDELMVEEKGVHSVEKFIIARRLMYWQVYLHKAVLGAEQLLVNILKRAKELASEGQALFATTALQNFLYNNYTLEDFEKNPELLASFCQLDDSDVLTSVKVWQDHKDSILSRLCNMIIQRRLYKTILTSGPINTIQAEIEDRLKTEAGLSTEELPYFVCSGTTSTSTYNTEDERITIALKNGNTCDISEIENPLVNQALARPVHKNYICFIQR